MKFYRSAARYDLQCIGVDLAEEVAARRFTKLMDLLDEMPQGAHWRAAHDNDPESAARLHEADLSLDTFTPPLAGWTMEMDALASISDHTQIAAGKYIENFEFKPFPRPKNPLGEAIEKLRKRMKKNKAVNDIEEINRRFMPHLVNTEADDAGAE